MNYTGSWRWMAKILQLSLSTSRLQPKSSRYEGKREFSLFCYLNGHLNLIDANHSHLRIRVRIWIRIWIWINFKFWWYSTGTHVAMANDGGIENRYIKTQFLLSLSSLTFSLSLLFILINIYRWHGRYGCTICAKSRNYWIPYSLFCERNRIKSRFCICTIIHWCHCAVLLALNTLRVSWHHHHHCNCDQLTNKPRWKFHNFLSLSLSSSSTSSKSLS